MVLIRRHHHHELLLAVPPGSAWAPVSPASRVPSGGPVDVPTVIIQAQGYVIIRRRHAEPPCRCRTFPRKCRSTHPAHDAFPPSSLLPFLALGPALPPLPLLHRHCRCMLKRVHAHNFPRQTVFSRETEAPADCTAPRPGANLDASALPLYPFVLSLGLVWWAYTVNSRARHNQFMAHKAGRGCCTTAWACAQYIGEGTSYLVGNTARPSSNTVVGGKDVLPGSRPPEN
jgi:hypothetical protein